MWRPACTTSQAEADSGSLNSQRRVSHASVQRRRTMQSIPAGNGALAMAMPAHDPTPRRLILPVFAPSTDAPFEGTLQIRSSNRLSLSGWDKIHPYLRDSVLYLLKKASDKDNLTTATAVIDLRYAPR